MENDYKYYLQLIHLLRLKDKLNFFLKNCVLMIIHLLVLPSLNKRN